MATTDDLFDAHRFEINGAVEGWFWVCACGESCQPWFKSEGAATRDAQRHVAEAMGFEEPTAIADSLLYPVLSRICDAGRLLDPEDLTEFGSFTEVMDVLNELDRRGWITTANDVRGDDRLLSARGVGPSPEGRSAYQTAMLQAVDIIVAAEPDAEPAEPLVDVLAGVEAKRKARAQFMDLLYQQAGGSPLRPFDATQLGRQLGWTKQVTADVVRYLHDEGLLTREGWGGIVSITHEGVREVEQMHTEPERPTEHFPPGNVVIVAGNNYGQIQAGTSHSQQSISGIDVSAITNFLHELTTALQAADVEPATRGLVEANISQLSDALTAEGPDGPTVLRVLPMLRDFAVNLAASGAFLGLVEAIQQL